MTTAKLTIDEIKALIDPKMLKGNQFAAKLNFDQRCQILALEWLGYSRRLTAKAYGVNRSTINFIVTPSSPHYRNVRRKFAELGKEAFISEYINADVIAHVAEFRNDPEVALTSDELKAQIASRETDTPKKGAKSHEGQHRLRDVRWDQSYLVNVGWSEFDGVHGWVLWVDGEQVAKLLDLETAPSFHHNTNDPAGTGESPELFKTSKAALDSWKHTHGAEDA